MSDTTYGTVPVRESTATGTRRFWERVDEFCTHWGDRINPILVKETRQALKSRQFAVTFSMLLFAALAWTIVGSLSMMPQIYTSPSAQRMLVGYYIVLAIPMLLVVPLAAYRSLEGEIDDGTLELLSISTLSPRQIVMGKLASALLQMMLYFIALFPCVAYAYTLRGVDLPTVALLMSLLLVAGLTLTSVALFFAPLAASRTGRIATLLAVLFILVIAEYAVGGLSISLILYGNPLSAHWIAFLWVSAVLGCLVVGHLLTSTAAAQLTPESENRSTSLRLAMLGLTATFLGINGYAVFAFGPASIEFFISLNLVLLALWTVAGSMMSAESPAMTPRIRRELPNSFLARSLLTWITPGPATGVVFASICVIAVAGMIYFLAGQYDQDYWRFSTSSTLTILPVLQLVTAYLVAFFVGVRCVVAVVRINNHPRVEIGIAAFVSIAVLAALVPYSIGMHLNDYRPYAYSGWQSTNWVWTLGQAVTGRLDDGHLAGIVLVSAVMLLGCVLAAGKLTLPRRIATPKRVLEEMEAAKNAG